MGHEESPRDPSIAHPLLRATEVYHSVAPRQFTSGYLMVQGVPFSAKFVGIELVVPFQVPLKPNPL